MMSFFRSLAVLRASVACAALVFAAACGGDEDATVGPTGTAPYSQTDIRVGTGAEATTGRTVTTTYTGWLFSASAAENKGQQFDSGTISFPLGAGRVIQGWDRGIAGMRVGGMRRLVIPPDLAYGAQTPDPSRIPPNATLVFDVELTGVQ